MRRPFVALALIVLTVPLAARQGTPDPRIRPITAPLRNAGTLHLATGTWTRKATTANLGADVVYDNTCHTGFYSPLSTDTFVDEGRLPSTSSPTNLISRPGCANAYTIDGFQIAYCTDQPAATFGTYTVRFYQSYAACTSVIGVTPTAAFAISGLPASGGGGLACWLVTIDLDSPPQSASLAFTMLADGDGSWTSPETSNLFGWSMSSTAQGTATGPWIAGDFITCSRYDGTRWDNGPPPAWPNNLGEEGTGMGTQDVFRVEGGTTPPGCYFGSGSLVRSFHLELYADACPGDVSHHVYCFGDGSGTPCPCGNASAPAAAAGCLNSLGLAGRLRGTGAAGLSADAVRLTASDVPPNASLLFFQGTTRVNGGAGTTFGDGLRCAGGTVVRIGTKVASASGTAQYPEAGNAPLHTAGQIAAPGVRTYQAWYRNVAPFCTSEPFNLTNGVEIVWGA